MFTNSPLPMLAAEKAHRAHAIVEQVIADVKNGPLAHLPSGHFWANGAWLVCATMAFNLTRAAGTLASSVHAKATTATIRAQLITVPGRLARSARRLTLHLHLHLPSVALAEGLGPAGDSRQQPTNRGLTPPTPSARTNRNSNVETSRPARPPRTPSPHQQQDHHITMVIRRSTVDPG